MSRPAKAALHWTTSERAKAPIFASASSISPCTGRLVARQRDHLGDVHALVAHALDVLDHVQQRRHEPQVAGDGRLQREQREDALVDLEVAPVDAVVVGDHHLRELDVLVLERLEHAVELLDDQVQAAERVLLERLAAAPGSARARGRSRARGAACGAVGQRMAPAAARPSGLAELAGDIFLGSRVGGFGEDLLGRSDLDELAVEHERRAVGDARGLLHVVGDDHDRDARA